MNDGSTVPAGGSSGGGRGVPAAILNALDLILVLAALWFLLPPLILGRVPEIGLPLKGHISGGLTPHNLYVFWFLLLVRICLRARPGQDPWVGRIFPLKSAFVEGLLMVVAFLLVYLNVSQTRVWPSGDTIPTKLLPISILEEGDLDLGEFSKGIIHARKYGFYHIQRRAYSAYPIGPAITALPVYALCKALFPESFRTWKVMYRIREGDDQLNVANLMEQWSAGLIAALAVLVFWRFCLAAGAGRRISLWLTVALGLGTSLLSTASLALWQHGPACLFLGLMMLLLLKAEGPTPASPPLRRRGEETGVPSSEGTGGVGASIRLLLAGVCAGWAYFCRPICLPILAVATPWVMWRFRRRSAWFLLPLLVIGAAVSAWNQAMFGNFVGPYARHAGAFVPFDLEVMVTLLFSPSRGLLVFSPFLLFAAVAGARQILRAPLSLGSVCVYGALVMLILFSCWSTWAGGASFGARYLCEAALLLCLVLPFGAAALTHRRALWAAFVVAVLFSCHVHILGARSGDHGWTSRVFKGDDMATIWNWRDSQLAWALGGGGSRCPQRDPARLEGKPCHL